MKKQDFPDNALLGAPATAPLLTRTQRQSVEAIVNVFETGAVLGDYGQVTLIPGDTGHLTFGRSQTTLGSGNLARLLERYVGNPAARFRDRLQPFLPRVRDRDTALDQDSRFKNLLRACADDPVMRDTQDAFFAAACLQPSLDAAMALGVRTPLAVAVVYDSHVHGSWELIRSRVQQRFPTPASAGGEQAWIAAYVDARRDWLAHSERDDLRKTVYRMDSFRRLIDQGFWGLALPFVVRGCEISLSTLNAQPPGCYDGPQPGSRLLALQSPLARGLDVRVLQLAMSDRDIDLVADAVFGPTSATKLRQFQQSIGLAPTGIADPAVWEVVLSSELPR
jgi:chitosanase